MSVNQIRKETAQRMGGGGSEELMAQCSECPTFASLATLSTYGNRCFPCYQAYCRAAADFKYPAEEDRSPWAQALRREIEAAGKPLPR